VIGATARQAFDGLLNRHGEAVAGICCNKRVITITASPHSRLEFPVPGRYLGARLCYDRAMMLKQRMMSVLGAAIVLIVLSLAPPVAKAHVGHPHHAPAHVHAGHGHVSPAQSERATAQAVLQLARPGQTEAPASVDRNCVGACCTSVCASCCAAGLPNFTQLAPLPRLTTRVAFAPSQLGPDRAPESLRRPPKHFV